MDVSGGKRKTERTIETCSVCEHRQSGKRPHNGRGKKSLKSDDIGVRVMFGVDIRASGTVTER